MKIYDGLCVHIIECVISWKEELQDTVTLSMTETEYMAVVKASKNGLWLRGLIETFSIIQDSVRVHCAVRAQFISLRITGITSE